MRFWLGDNATTLDLDDHRRINCDIAKPTSPRSEGRKNSGSKNMSEPQSMAKDSREVPPSSCRSADDNRLQDIPSMHSENMDMQSQD
jgi:hypothetical protein